MLNNQALTAKAKFLEGKEFFDAEKYDEALSCFKIASQFDATVADYINYEGDALWYLGNYEEALACFDKAIELDPSNPEYFKNKSYTLTRLDRDEEAIDYFGAVIKLAPLEAEYHNEKGNALHRLQQYDEAIKCFDEAIRLAPDMAEYHNAKGDALHELQQYRDAIKCFDEAIRLAPDVAEYHISKGRALYELTKYPKAILCFDEAIKLAPDVAQYYVMKGEALYELGKYPTAIECFDEAIRLAPLVAEYHATKGNKLALLKEKYSASISLEMSAFMPEKSKAESLAMLNLLKDADALAYLDKAIELDPDNPQYRIDKQYAKLMTYTTEVHDKRRATTEAKKHYEKGIAHFEAADYEAARDCYETAVSYDPKNAQYCNSLGKAYFALSKHYEARACYERAIELLHCEPLFRETVVHDYLNNFIESCIAVDDYQGVINFFSELESGPKFKQTKYFNLGKAYFMLGDIGCALEHFDQINEAKCNDPWLYYYKGQCAFKNDNLEEASRCYDKARSLYESSRDTILQAKLEEAYTSLKAALAYNEGLNYYKTNHPAKALESFNRAIELDPKKTDFHLYKITVLNYCYQYDAALSALDIAIALDPKNADYHAQKGNTYYYRGQYETALEYFIKAHQLNSTVGNYYYSIADTYLILKRFPEAIKYLDLAILHEAELLDECYAKKAKTLLESNDINGALSWLDEVTDDRREEDFYLYKAEALLARGATEDYPNAAIALNKAENLFFQQYQIDPTDKDIIFIPELAEVYLRLAKAYKESADGRNGAIYRDKANSLRHRFESIKAERASLLLPQTKISPITGPDLVRRNTQVSDEIIGSLSHEPEDTSLDSATESSRHSAQSHAKISADFEEYEAAIADTTESALVPIEVLPEADSHDEFVWEKLTDSIRNKTDDDEKKNHAPDFLVPEFEELVTKTHHQVMIVNDMGFGKTMFCRYLYSSQFNDEGDLKTAKLRVYINLTELMQKETNDNLIALLAQYLLEKKYLRKSIFDKPKIEKALLAKMPHLVFLFDGLDECPSAKQKHFVRSLQAYNKHISFILTSRPTSIIDEVEKQSSYNKVALSETPTTVINELLHKLNFVSTRSSESNMRKKFVDMLKTPLFFKEFERIGASEFRDSTGRDTFILKPSLADFYLILLKASLSKIKKVPKFNEFINKLFDKKDKIDDPEIENILKAAVVCYKAMHDKKDLSLSGKDRKWIDTLIQLGWCHKSEDQLIWKHLSYKEFLIGLHIARTAQEQDDLKRNLFAGELNHYKEIFEFTAGLLVSHAMHNKESIAVKTLLAAQLNYLLAHYHEESKIKAILFDLIPNEEVDPTNARAKRIKIYEEMLQSLYIDKAVAKTFRTALTPFYWHNLYFLINLILNPDEGGSETRLQKVFGISDKGVENETKLTEFLDSVWRAEEKGIEKFFDFKPELKAGTGRIDLYLKPKVDSDIDTAIIFEFKKGAEADNKQSLLNKAINQALIGRNSAAAVCDMEASDDPIIVFNEMLSGNTAYQNGYITTLPSASHIKNIIVVGGAYILESENKLVKPKKAVSEKPAAKEVLKDVFFKVFEKLIAIDDLKLSQCFFSVLNAHLQQLKSALFDTAKSGALETPLLLEKMTSIIEEAKDKVIAASSSAIEKPQHTLGRSTFVSDLTTLQASPLSSSLTASSFTVAGNKRPRSEETSVVLENATEAKRPRLSKVEAPISTGLLFNQHTSMPHAGTSISAEGVSYHT